MAFKDSVVLVVGTTGDYIKYIQKNYSEEVIFLTDPVVYNRNDKNMNFVGNIHCDLTNIKKTLQALENFLEKGKLNLIGVTAYDCESLCIASVIAEKYNLPYASLQSVKKVRDKNNSKKIWHENNILCPVHTKINREEDFSELIKKKGFPVVIKPAFLSGSELTFICNNKDELGMAYNFIKNRLNYLVSDNTTNRDGFINEDSIVLEEYIKGDEYSCDFTIKNEKLKILRITRKYLLENGPFGTAIAYETSDDFKNKFSLKLFENELKRALISLGIENCFGMCDFIVKNKKTYLLEISPRTGGDCLPWLLQRSASFNTIIENLNFAQGKEISIPDKFEHLIGVRIHAEKEGLLKKVYIDAQKVKNRILEAKWIVPFGKRITLPPLDYSNWYLGFIIFEPFPHIPVKQQIDGIREAVIVEYERERELNERYFNPKTSKKFAG